MKILEEFDGIVNQFDGDTAHVTLTTKSGEKLRGEYPVAELLSKGIKERRRFKCWTFEADNGNVGIGLEAIPDVEISEEEERRLDEELKLLLGDDE